MYVISVVSRPLPAIAAHCDSRTTIDKISSSKYNVKTKKHIQVRLKSIRDLVSNRVITVEFIRTQDYIDDHLTNMPKGERMVIGTSERWNQQVRKHLNSKEQQEKVEYELL